MASKDTNLRSSGEYSVIDITAVYKAMSTGRPRAAAYLMWKWASLVALGATAFYVVAHFVIKYW